MMMSGAQEITADVPEDSVLHDKQAGDPKKVRLACGAFGQPTAFACGNLCTEGIDQDPPMCFDAQGGIKAKSQPFVVGAVVKSCGLGRGRREVFSCAFC